MKYEVGALISGGVDSATSAYLLSQKYKKKVLLIFGAFLSPSSPKLKLQRQKVESLAEVLGLPLKVIDLHQEFEKRVMDYFVKQYASGFTPNPCVVCNAEIKFGFLLKEALRKAKKVASGHYARLRRLNGEYYLFRAKDSSKEQSYFLWRISKKILPYLVFPLGNKTKEEVKRMADEFGYQPLPESTDLCFASDIKAFLAERLPRLARPGEVLDLKGKVIGRHRGIIFYTIGQRSGFELDKTKLNRPTSLPPLYVKKIIPQHNQIVVAPRQFLYQREIKVAHLNWFIRPSLPLEALVQIRYGHSPTKSVLKKQKDELQIKFKEPVFAPTPGQSAVFYEKDKLLGGGEIQP
ncbi:tRNA 2-thiouridine(34) synthase MnmA [bacterium]|nr:tRNA 2-thiouridine(34) synthase MnmA [bacterium]